MTEIVPAPIIVTALFGRQDTAFSTRCGASIFRPSATSSIRT